MADLDRYIPGVPCWIDSSHPDPLSAGDFYRGLFGWELEDAMPADDPRSYLIARLHGGDVAAISGLPEGALPGTPAWWNTYVWVERADASTQRVRDAGGTVLAEPFDVFAAGRMAVCADPEGAAFSLWEPHEHRGAQVVNEPGALAFNGLSTRDLERAQRFYGAVFGWELLPLDAGLMWALPGYGEHLERRSPGTLARMDALGAPRGFADVVASVSLLAPSARETPAHWGVTFAVADARVSAARAEQLGGVVVAAPLDVPWSRIAVLADPQGAMFVISQFVPENRDVEAPAGEGVRA